MIEFSKIQQAYGESATDQLRACTELAEYCDTVPVTWRKNKNEAFLGALAQVTKEIQAVRMGALTQRWDDATVVENMDKILVNAFQPYSASGLLAPNQQI